MEHFLNKVSCLRVDMLHCIEFIIMIVNLIWGFILTNDWQQSLVISIFIWTLIECLVLVFFSLLIYISKNDQTKARLIKKEDEYFHYICSMR